MAFGTTLSLVHVCIQFVTPVSNVSLFLPYTIYFPYYESFLPSFFCLISLPSWFHLPPSLLFLLISIHQFCRLYVFYRFLRFCLYSFLSFLSALFLLYVFVYLHTVFWSIQLLFLCFIIHLFFIPFFLFSFLTSSPHSIRPYSCVSIFLPPVSVTSTLSSYDAR